MKKLSNTVAKAKGKCVTLNFDNAKPWADADIGFNLMNYEYPLLHDHDFWEIFIVSKGRINHLLNGNLKQMNQGDACFIKPNDQHNIRLVHKNDEVQYLSFTISNDYFSHFVHSYKNNMLDIILSENITQYFSIDSVELLKYLNTCLTFNNNKRTLEETVLQCKILFIDIFNGYVQQLNKINTIFPEWFSNFILELNNHNCFSTSIKELAQKTPYSYSRLTRIFKSLTGYTLTSYLTSLKMKRASEYLLNSDMTILEISSMLNYSSSSHFLRTFKKFYKLSPKQYKKINRS